MSSTTLTASRTIHVVTTFLRQLQRHSGIPYRRGYLPYGPAGTRKSSLRLSIAGYFDLDIYILSLSAISEESLRSLLMADLFCLVFKPMEGDITLLKSAQSDMSNRLGENSKVHEAVRIQEEEVKGVEQRVCCWGAGAEIQPSRKFIISSGA
jgi:hypothetical protein